MGGRRPESRDELRHQPQDPARGRPRRVVGVVHPGAAGPPEVGPLAPPPAGSDRVRQDAGAPAIEGYPVDNKGKKVDLTMAYVGTRQLFEQAGFEKAADTTSTLDGFPRVLMRLGLSYADLREAAAGMIVIDAANVIGSRPTGWWRDRPGAARRFTEQVRATVAGGRLDPPVAVVLEGRPRRGAEGVVHGVEVVHAPGEGDDTIVALARGAARGGRGHGRSGRWPNECGRPTVRSSGRAGCSTSWTSDVLTLGPARRAGTGARPASPRSARARGWGRRCPAPGPWWAG